MFRKKQVVSPPLSPEFQKHIAEELERSLAAEPAAYTCKVRITLSKGKTGGASFCGRNVMEGYEFCYWHLPDLGKYSSTALEKYFGREITLAEALEEEVASGHSLENAFLQDCHLGGSFLKKGPNLMGARFMGANLRGAWMSESNLTDAVFALADLTRAGLSSCILSGANFYNARLFEVKFRGNDLESVKNLYRLNFRGLGKFGIPTDRILEEYPEQAMPMYRALVSYFSMRGQLEDASWAAYRASLLQHRILTKELSITTFKAKRWVGIAEPRLAPVQAPPYMEYLSLLVRWVMSGLVLLITGYGERPFRVVVAALILILGYSGLYCIPGAISGHGFSDALYFSVVTFTTLGYGDVLPHGAFRLLAGSEALSGILFTGLFLFCLGRKTVSRS
jgi:uncharacterized protein YjbI with pentapeptide repeats